MTEAARAKRNEYKRKWYAANKEKAKESQERYWEKKSQVEQIPGQIELKQTEQE